jgi:hypothetical protein
MSVLANTLKRFMKSDDRKELGDLEELREAFHQVERYLQFQLDHFDRQQANRQLMALV